jgi:predicted AlkP superfamily phosphohydrolase/phosphomutase
MDRIVGDVRALLDPGDVLLVVSDHGFQTWRWAVNVNQWLVDEGYMVLRDGADAARERVLKGLFSGEIPPSDVDWTRTRAYAMGLGQVFLNRRGREAFGIVEDAEVAGLVAEISGKLRQLKNPHAKDEPAVTDVYPLHEIWKGPYVAEAAEMQIGFANGYRISWQTALLGGMSRHGVVIEENLVPWSGDHCSTDPGQVPGVLLCNRRIPPPPAQGYHLRDVAPTVLSWYGLDWSGLDGRPIPLESAP